MEFGFVLLNLDMYLYKGQGRQWAWHPRHRRQGSLCPRPGRQNPNVKKKITFGSWLPGRGRQDLAPLSEAPGGLGALCWGARPLPSTSACKHSCEANSIQRRPASSPTPPATLALMQSIYRPSIDGFFLPGMHAGNLCRVALHPPYRIEFVHAPVVRACWSVDRVGPASAPSSLP